MQRPVCCTTVSQLEYRISPSLSPSLFRERERETERRERERGPSRDRRRLDEDGGEGEAEGCTGFVGPGNSGTKPSFFPIPIRHFNNPGRLPSGRAARTRMQRSWTPFCLVPGVKGLPPSHCVFISRTLSASPAH